MVTWNPELHERVLAAILPELMRGVDAQAPARVWVPSCFTGQDAYTLAICLFEAFRSARKPPHVRIFATDPDESALARARSGLCEQSISHAMPKELLERYFHRTARGGCRVNESVRRVLVFGMHDVLEDPPIFSNLSLISYRGVPANLEPEARQRLTRRLHFSLRDCGWLVLKAGRTDAADEELFEPILIDSALFQKRCTAELSSHSTSMSEIESISASAHLRDELSAANSTIASLARNIDTANKELRASNADLRSLSEELIVLNNELQTKIRAVNETNADLAALIATIDVAVVVVDAELRIRRFKSNAAGMLRLTQGDIGQPLSTGDTELLDSALAEEARHVIETSTASEMEIPSSTGHWYLRRILPRMETEHAPGVIVTWLDITQTKLLQQEVLSISALEQQRIGRELHDDIQQELTGLSLLAQNLSERCNDPHRMIERQLVDRLLRGLTETNRHVRSLARGLVPIPVDTGSLMPALVDLARRTQDAFGISCQFQQNGAPKVSDTEKASHLYRIAQEAVRNAARHSKASEISIRLESHADDLLLEIRDDGIGIGRRSEIHQGMGVRLMEHRCSMIGGKFTAEPQLGGGTVIACRVPFNAPRSAA